MEGAHHGRYPFASRLQEPSRRRSALGECAAQTPGLLALRADVAVSADVGSLFARLQQSFGGLDVLVNNAGVSGPTKPVEDVTDEEWNRTLAVNVTGQFYAVRAAVPMFRSAVAA